MKKKTEGIGFSLKVKGTAGPNISECEQIILREGPQTRLLFEARLVDNQPGSGVRGFLKYQKKQRNQDWDTCTRIGLRQVQVGEELRIELKSECISKLRQWLVDLQSIADEFGAPVSETTYFGLRHSPLAELLGGKRVSVQLPKSLSTAEFDALRKLVLKNGDIQQVLEALSDSSTEDLLAMRHQFGVSALNRLLEAWDADPDHPSEEYWQDLLTTHIFALEQVFHTPSFLVADKAYMGGKSVKNTGGHFVDFLHSSSSTGRPMLIEIKTPSSRLLKKKNYRNGVWTPANDLMGGTLQTLTYRDSLLAGISNLAPDLLQRITPRCAVILGCTEELDTDDKKRCFELFRDQTQVVVLTFDELKARIENVRDALTSIEGLVT